MEKSVRFQLPAKPFQAEHPGRPDIAPGSPEQVGGDGLEGDGPAEDALNQMLGRLEHGFRQRKQFMADAAHELRTPVTALLTSIEVALRQPREAPALTRTLQDCVGDVTAPGAPVQPVP